MHTLIQPDSYVVLRLPSETLKVVQIAPNTTIPIGKYGSFQANLLLGRPYNLTFEILDKDKDHDYAYLRVVGASELHAEALAEEDVTPAEHADGKIFGAGDGVEYELVGENGEVLMRTNRETIDDSATQKMTMEEIETLKREGSGAGKDLIAKLILSHSGLDQKTSFSLAKYTLRKTKKYIRRFTVLPLDVPMLAHWIMTDREPVKIMEMRGEILALMGSWANIHHSGASPLQPIGNANAEVGGHRWLVVDETGGLVVAAMAERIGILYPAQEDETSESEPSTDQEPNVTSSDTANGVTKPQASSPTTERSQHHHDHIPGMSALNNTITLLHANAQPNLSLLKYFGFDTSNPTTSHPLHTHLKTLSWLQLLSPTEDIGYTEPEIISPEVLQTYKSSKRGTYYRKRRRWQRIKSVVDSTRAGGFDGLIVASVMDPATILHNTLPLLRGAAQVVIYSPNIEPLVELADLYSTTRRTAYVTASADEQQVLKEDFPLNPTLLLAPSIQTARVKNWQVLPGRTHPLMTGRGGAEGYLFTATRVLPAEGRVEARGKFKRRKTIRGEDVSGQAAPDVIAKAEDTKLGPNAGTEVGGVVEGDEKGEKTKGGLEDGSC
ncbi:MAG: tRNA (adenine(58)-N(1))-methyltransferase non-catalytic subunit trm6 [Candelina mexicana]|nr:MAG: tRNA (adenine(58)-N(1))-methyltransferase non-catalytic subunit trm6 [Candelina mexicana]